MDETVERLIIGSPDDTDEALERMEMVSSVRKDVMQDPAVQAAYEAFRAAVIAVNGDPKITDMLVYMDIEPNKELFPNGEGPGSVTIVKTDLCHCDYCLGKVQTVVDIILENLHDKREELGLEVNPHRRPMN